ncbi:MAG: Rieske 2Fe-2S domain-containing protein [Actinobacteria bacterium]|uniref:Rieske iron-sulfur protein n=1 Tax=freshwater metagenome TaxID=449393 RepID=A0A6J6PLI8_9ZZZZ|nr:Rieske 2Fe-2S domain-containing protein [Actinomycetota bacterium]
MTEINSGQGHGASENTPVKLGYSPVADIPHRPRVADTDPKAARRAERQVSSMFLLSMLFVVLFIIAFVAIDKSATVYLPVFGVVGAMNITLGFTMGAAIFLIGAGAIQWAKKLMPDVEVVQERHDLASPTESTGEAAANYERGKEESGFARFKIIRRTLIGAMVLFPIPLIVMLRDLWISPPGNPSPSELLTTTLWKDGTRVVTDPTYLPIRPEDIPVGGLVSAAPEDLEEVQIAEGNLDARGKSAIILVRMDPAEIVSQQGDGWDYQGIVAYSKICTHVGCPIALYEQRTHHLLCPCHQSTFDLADSGNVVFGPAARRMPQLPIGVDVEGFIVAKAPFAEPVGPSFWERG